MFKNFFSILILLFVSSQIIFAREIPIKITPFDKITTSDFNLEEGDCVEFVVMEDVRINSKRCFKKGQKVWAIITSREENGFLGKTANLYIENFYTRDIDGKKINLHGVIYKKGTCHDVLTGFLKQYLIIIRGGEVQIKPEIDLFTVYAEGG